MNTMQRALRINAIFSGLSGFLLIIFTSKFADIFGVGESRPFWIIGLVLLFFAGTIVLEIFKQRKLAIKWIIIQDYLWFIASAVLVIWNPLDISIIGNVIITIIAVIVLAMGFNQMKALSKV